MIQIVGLTVTVWLGSLMLLFILGLALSAMTLRAVRRPPPERTGAIRLRGVYRTVLWLCCVYYYISLPLVMLVVIGLGAGLFYGLIVSGEISIGSFMMMGFIPMAVGVTVWAGVKSTFARVKEEDPGQRLSRDDAPGLHGVLDEVARAMDTRPVQTVFITPGTDLAVMERGGMLRQFRGMSERCLILGVGVLDGLPLGALQAMLAHEYGHFSNRDTAGGAFALAVRRSLVHMAQVLIEEEVAAWYNPSWLFLNAFDRVFLRISQGASRLQEVLADRTAAAIYGARLFEQGLRHVVERSVRFAAHVDATVRDVIDNQQPLINVYTHQPPAIRSEMDLHLAVDAAMRAQPTPYDSHPAPNQRIEWVQAVGAQATPPWADSDAAVWPLFRDRAALEQSMTRLVNDAIDQRFGKSKRVPGRPR